MLPSAAAQRSTAPRGSARRFHGAMAPTTPTGADPIARCRDCRRAGLPDRLVSDAAAWRKSPGRSASGTSQNPKVAPVSRASIETTSSRRSDVGGLEEDARRSAGDDADRGDPRSRHRLRSGIPGAAGSTTRRVAVVRVAILERRAAHRIGPRPAMNCFASRTASLAVAIVLLPAMDPKNGLRLRSTRSRARSDMRAAQARRRGRVGVLLEARSGRRAAPDGMPGVSPVKTIVPHTEHLPRLVFIEMLF